MYKIVIDSCGELPEELKDDICSYNLSIDKSNFFVKKAELILNETLNR